MNKKIRILHLEDSRKDSDLISSIIKTGEIEFDYFFTDNEKDYLRILENENIDVILSDFNLPDYNGNEALKVVREKYSHIPFIFVSGTMGEDAAINAMLNGAMDYVLKSNLVRLVPAIKRGLCQSENEFKRRQAEQALKESEEKFRSYIEYSPDGVFIIDETGRYVDVNKAACLISGYSKEEIILLSIQDLLADESRVDGLTHFKKLMETGAYTSDLWLKKKDGSKYCVSLAAVKFSETRFLGFTKDITKRKKAEEELIIAKEHAEQSDRLKSVFLANMSHEIRTPLNAIVGFSALFSDPGISQEDKLEFSKIIQSRSDDLLHIINDILEISRIESGNAKTVKNQVVVNDILDEMKESFSVKINQLNKPDLELICEKSMRSGQFRIITDKHIFKKVFFHLLENAIKFTDSGTIRFGFGKQDNQTLTFFVSDTGIGITPENRELIFENFRQVIIEKPHRLYGGTGLGLPICRGLLALLHGKIWVESVPGEGSTFYFTIPFEQNPALKTEPIQKSEKRKVEISYNWAGKKLLLVEDDEANMNLLTFLLKKTKAELVYAYNGKDVRQQFDKLDKFDLVLLDIRLPDANGWDLAREIKTLRPGLPIIAQTAFAMSTDKKKSEEMGCDGYISKPYIQNQLFQIISKNLEILKPLMASHV